MKTGAVAFAKWVAANAHSAVVRGMDASAIAADLRASGLTVRVDETKADCFEGATEDVVVIGVAGSPQSPFCFKGPPMIVRGRRDAEPKNEIYAFEEIHGGPESEVFASRDAARKLAGSPYVPIDRDLVPDGHGRWSAFGQLLTTSDGHVAVQLLTHEVRVVVENADDALTAAASKKGAWARVTGSIRLDRSDDRKADVAMKITHVDGVVDAASYAALQTKADAASARAAQSLRALHNESKARDALAPARDAFVRAFGADVDRARFFAAAITAFDSEVPALAYAYARASVANIADPKWSQKDSALRHAIFVHAYDALEPLALGGDEDEGRRAARVLWKIIEENREEVHYPTLDAIYDRFRGEHLDLAPPI